MMKHSRFTVPLLSVALTTAYASAAWAQGMQQGYGYSSTPEQSANVQLQNFTGTVNPSYGSEIGAKAANGFANLLTSPLEIPKNMIIVTNQSNVFYGIIGGIFKGLVHTAGRMAVGLTDFVFFPLPTKPVAHPLYIWDDFDRDTTYSDIFRMQDSQPAQAPVPQAAAPSTPVAVTSAPPAVADGPAPSSQGTNEKIDTLFKQKMMK